MLLNNVSNVIRALNSYCEAQMNQKGAEMSQMDPKSAKISKNNHFTTLLLWMQVTTYFLF